MMSHGLVEAGRLGILRDSDSTDGGCTEAWAKPQTEPGAAGPPADVHGPGRGGSVHASWVHVVSEMGTRITVADRSSVAY